MTTNDPIELHLADGSTLSLPRDEALRLTEKLHDASSLDGALSLAAQLADRLKATSLLGRTPIELLRREERALRSVLAAGL